MTEMSFRLPEEWARAVAARVARTIRNACGQEADKNADVADQIDDACDTAVSATLQVLAEEFNGRDRLHDDAALATAAARARREALEEAAEVCDLRVFVWRHHIGKPSQTDMDEQVASLFKNAAAAIRSLAATPPEDRQIETGWKPPAGWKLVPEEATDAMLSAPLAPGSSITGARYESRRDLRPLIYRAMLEAAPPPPAIGNLEGEPRS